MEAPTYGEAPESDIIVVGLPYEGIKFVAPRRFFPVETQVQKAIYARSGAILQQLIYYCLDHSDRKSRSKVSLS
jgi:hypothetical protein